MELDEYVAKLRREHLAASYIVAHCQKCKWPFHLPIAQTRFRKRVLCYACLDRSEGAPI